MVVKRTFATKLESVDAFGLSNELLRPRGFQLDKGNPPRNQGWRRGVEPGKKAKGFFDAPQSIELEFLGGRISLTATAAVMGRRAKQGEQMMAAYADAIEKLLSTGGKPRALSRGPARVERSIRAAAFSRSVSICIILIALVGGAALAFTKLPGVPDPIKWVNAQISKAGSTDSKGPAEVAAPKGGKKSAPVIVVRKAGAQTTSADKPSEPH